MKEAAQNRAEELRDSFLKECKIGEENGGSVILCEIPVILDDYEDEYFNVRIEEEAISCIAALCVEAVDEIDKMTEEGIDPADIAECIDLNSGLLRLFLDIHRLFCDGAYFDRECFHHFIEGVCEALFIPLESDGCRFFMTPCLQRALVYVALSKTDKSLIGYFDDPCAFLLRYTLSLCEYISGMQIVEAQA